MFFGGEPLIAFESIKSTVLFFENLKKEKKISKLPKFNIVTNATLVDDGIAKFFADKSINITIPLDGPEDINDKLRIHKDNRGTFNDIKLAIKTFQKYKAKSDTVECTYTSLHKDMAYSKEYLNDYFKNEFSFKNIIISDCHGDTRYAIDKDMNNLDFSIQTKARIYRMLNNKNRVYCDVGINSISLDAYGNIYPCHFFIYNKENIICNINNFNLESRITQKIINLNNYNDGKCANCWAREICSICPANLLIFDQIDKIGNSKYCQIRREKIEDIFLETIEELG